LRIGDNSLLLSFSSFSLFGFSLSIDMATHEQLDFIRVEHLIKIYHLGEVEVHALRGVSLSIARGEFVAIMGSSGSGKSTFMNILGCLDRPTSGQYILDGVEVSTLNADERAEIRNTRLGFIFQNFNLLARTSALENVELPLIYSAVSLEEQRSRALAALKAVGLEGREHHLSSQLSGGQQQRVAIARALINHPVVILADEPTGNLDSATSKEVMQIFTALNQQGITVVLVTHEADIAAFAQRRIVFRDGLVVADEKKESFPRALQPGQSSGTGQS
jgi:putative ABC transport system ATP-binding protein